jgi:hypothetical protein
MYRSSALEAAIITCQQCNLGAYGERKLADRRRIQAVGC